MAAISTYQNTERSAPSTPASPISPRGGEFSNPPGGTREYDGVAGAAPFLVCGGRRRIRAVDTRVTNCV